MQTLDHEEILKTPLPGLILTNRRVRYVPTEKLVQSMSLQQIAMMGIEYQVMSFAKQVSVFLTSSAIVGIVSMLYVDDKSMPADVLTGILGGLAITIVAYYLSRKSSLVIRSTGTDYIVIVVNHEHRRIAEEAMDLIEKTKLRLE